MEHDVPDTPEGELQEMPVWAALAVGLCASVFACGYAVGGEIQPVFSIVGLVGFLVIALRLSQRNGVENDPRTQPRELSMLQLRLVVETALLAAVLVGVGKATNPWVSVALAGPLFAVIFYLHDQRYEAKTAEMRAARDS